MTQKIFYANGKKDKKGFAICKYNGVCGDVIGYASTFEQAKDVIKLYKGSDNA